jgi:hypothetical protein
MNWYLLSRQTSEAGNSDKRTATILLNADAVQCFQQTPTSTRVYLRSGALDSIDVVETIEEIVAQEREGDEPGQSG